MVLVIDGQGGNLGRRLIELLREACPDTEIIAVGTNSIATANMMRGGAVRGATGENAAAVACRRAEVIAGPVGIVVADALLGEVTPEMAKAVGQSSAARVLIPVNKCETLIAGVADVSTADLLADAVKKIVALLRHP